MTRWLKRLRDSTRPRNLGSDGNLDVVVNGDVRRALIRAVRSMKSMIVQDLIAYWWILVFSPRQCLIEVYEISEVPISSPTGTGNYILSIGVSFALISFPYFNKVNALFITFIRPMTGFMKLLQSCSNLVTKHKTALEITTQGMEWLIETRIRVLDLSSLTSAPTSVVYAFLCCGWAENTTGYGCRVTLEVLFCIGIL